MSDSSVLPPVRLRPEAELARDALAAPLLARAVRLARWAEPGLKVGADGELGEEELAAATARLGDGADGAATAAAWRVALGAGLVEVPDAADPEPGVVGGAALAAIASGSPADVLRLWLAALDVAVADAATGGGSAAGDEAAFLDGVLGNLYLLSADAESAAAAPAGADGHPGGAERQDEGRVPLPALAASVIMPEGMGEPSDDVLERVSEAMVRLDGQFRLLETVGLVEFSPVDEALMAEVEADADPAVTAAGIDPSDVARYGLVRLTPLGRHGLRRRLLDAGYEAPAVGDLASLDAAGLLRGTADYPQDAAQEEIEGWLERHEPLSGARELLAAARGEDPGAPLRRLRCQQALSLVGPAAEPALREVLDDPELGGLARVWLSERGAADVPPPGETMIFWLTIDTLAAQLDAEGNSPELQGLVEGLARQHSGFFDTAWRVRHPATADVLDAMGRLHPDKRVAKEARKAAFKARSRQED
ncbi:hypothetical protein [Streptomyces sp. NPDC050560]|uniref:hypothetical protein n=1 Tax=Streptomyces sp. NPDC050560 TaxID=3365630 RepID=UPI0037AD67BD